MNKWKIALILLPLFLVACSNDVVDEARITQENNNLTVEKEEKQEEQQDEEIKDLYEELEKPINEVIEKNDLDQRELMESEDIVEKNSYTDANEFAVFASNMLFRFQTGELTPGDYYTFLKNYGSRTLLETLPETEEGGITVYSNIQELFQSNNAIPDSYMISEVGLNKSKQEGYFYRLLNQGVQDEYYITTIVKEGSEWKYSEDSPSPPFEIKDPLQEGEKGNGE